MIQDNRPQSRQEQPQQDSVPSRTQQSDRPGTRSGAEPSSAMQQRRQRQYGLARRDQDYGYPAFGGGGPFTLLRRMEQEMDRMFEQFGIGSSDRGGQLTRGGEMPSLWAPQIEVFEREGKLHISTDLPGLNKDDIQVDVEDDMLIIQGERRSSNQDRDQQRGFYRTERSYGSFYRAIPLPEGVSTETCDATFRDGVLNVTFDAPTEQRRSKRLEIRDAATQRQPGSQAGGTEQGAAGKR